jgi:hypothetical protein
MKMQALQWRRDGADWILMSGRRCFGRVYPDGTHPGMWRSTLPNGRPSGMANLAWSKNAVLVMADWNGRASRRLHEDLHAPALIRV